MMSNTAQYLILFLAPLITAIAPLHSALLSLMILITLNYGSAFFCTYKGLKGLVRFAFIRALFNDANMKRFFKKVYEYIFAILSVGLFEVYILGLDGSSSMLENVSLMRTTIIGAGVIEINQMFINLECLTGSNILKRVQDLFPDVVKKYFVK